MIIDRFKSHTVGSHALDQPIGLPIVYLPSTVPVANRLLHIGLGQMPLVQPKYRVRTPNESLDSHVAKILRLFQDAARGPNKRPISSHMRSYDRSFARLMWFKHAPELVVLITVPQVEGVERGGSQFSPEGCSHKQCRPLSNCRCRRQLLSNGPQQPSLK